MSIEEKALEYERDCAYQSSYEGYIKGYNNAVDDMCKYIKKYCDDWTIECLIKHIKQ